MTSVAWAAGRRAWPDVALPLSAFRDRVQQLGVGPDDLRDHGADLYLAAACAAGDVRAVGLFSHRFVSAVHRHLGRMQLTDDQAQEVQQELLIKLLTGERPRIATYAGRAPLDAWVRVTAIRMALDRVPRDPNLATADEKMRDAFMRSLPLAADDVAAEPKVRDTFQRALDRCLAALPARDKSLLRMYFLEELNVDGIGVVFQVHRATAARWLVGLRKHILAEVRRDIGIELHPTSSEFRSLVRLVEPELHLSLERLLSSEGRR